MGEQHERKYDWPRWLLTNMDEAVPMAERIEELVREAAGASKSLHHCHAPQLDSEEQRRSASAAGLEYAPPAPLDGRLQETVGPSALDASVDTRVLTTDIAHVRGIYPIAISQANKEDESSSVCPRFPSIRAREHAGEGGNWNGRRSSKTVASF